MPKASSMTCTCCTQGDDTTRLLTAGMPLLHCRACQCPTLAFHRGVRGQQGTGPGNRVVSTTALDSLTRHSNLGPIRVLPQRSDVQAGQLCLQLQVPCLLYGARAHLQVHQVA